VSNEALCFALNLLSYVTKFSGDLGSVLRQLPHFRRSHAQEHDRVANPVRQVAHASLSKALLRFLQVFPLKGRTFGNIEPDQHSVTLLNSTVTDRTMEISHAHSRQ
jgi:hypothetical protein